ncbi:helix-turn-helix domain-containing protein [Lacticaseibacillus pantheris]|uniref:helix-turn-helix domain-containing protein n=1 Tax=Lacticaseibacillus pantheris TaxID=171523 RepID=UPI00265A3E09|nr:Rgg/GadR/MutR family transcriptional regulator [Lacticaseibacillus pantheris]WKF85307.1 helix-turn-helix domain-containing protein [Lacticaseibacillus pantheris]
MENIGGTFRLLRKSKHLSLDAVGKGIVTTSFLSRFERGQYDISVQNLNQLLERINVTWSEFVYINNDYKKNISNRISQCYLHEDIGGLEKIQQEIETNQDLTPTYHKLYSIMMKALIGSLTGIPLSKAEINTVIHYLSSVANWTSFELYLFGNTLMMLPIDNVVSLYKLMFQKGEEYNYLNTDNISSYTRVLNNAICYCCEQRRADEAVPMLEMFEKLIDHPRQFYERMKLLNLRGLVLYCTGNVTDGLESLYRSLFTCKLIDATTVLHHELSYLDHFLTDDEVVGLRTRLKIS